MADDDGKIPVSGTDTFDQIIDRSDQIASGIPQLGPIATSLLKNAIVIAALFSIAAASALAVSFPRPALYMLGLYAMCVVPPVVAICAIGAARWSVPFRVLCLVSLVALIGAFALIVQARKAQVAFDQVHMFALMMLALAPQFAGFWAATRMPQKAMGKPPLPIFQIGIATVISLTVVGALSTLVNVPDFEVAPSVLAATFVVALLPSLFASWCQARRERRLPVVKTDRQPDHISGMGASALILFAVVIVTLGIWAAESDRTAKIDKMAGTIVIFSLAFAFVMVAIAPYVPASRRLGKVAAALKWAVRPVGVVFSWIDSLLVFPVAGALGATQTNLFRRYVLLLGYIVPSAFLGWYLPPPYGLIPLGLSVAGAIAIARRWSWVEEDRENAMLNRNFEGSHIRVGFDQDLRDETLVAFMSLLFLVPLILRQMHMMLGHVFIADGAENDVFAWLSFFGTELAKGLPFVDWAEVYHVEGAAAIQVNAEGVGPAQHIIFATRILVDLVLLAAFLQAISISQRSRKLRDMFFIDRTIDRLDPFLESRELRLLVTNSVEGFELDTKRLESFPRYDPDRLEKLKQRGISDELGFAAAKLLDMYESGGPAEQLRREAESAKPNYKVCESLIEELSGRSDYEVGPLKAAHFALNSRVGAWQLRGTIVDLIGERVEERAAINALSEVLIGPGPGVADPRREVRLRALYALFKPAADGDRIARTSIEFAALNDGAVKIREEASRLSKTWRAEQPETSTI